MPTTPLSTLTPNPCEHAQGHKSISSFAKNSLRCLTATTTCRKVRGGQLRRSLKVRSLNRPSGLPAAIIILHHPRHEHERRRLVLSDPASPPFRLAVPAPLCVCHAVSQPEWDPAHPKSSAALSPARGGSYPLPRASPARRHTRSAVVRATEQ